MNFEICYNIIEKKFSEINLSKIDKDFSALIYLKNDNDLTESGYIYLAYINGEKIIKSENCPHTNIVVSLSTETFEKIYKNEIKPFKAFASGDIKVKGNIFFAMSVYKQYKS